MALRGIEYLIHYRRHGLTVDHLFRETVHLSHELRFAARVSIAQNTNGALTRTTTRPSI